MTKEQIKTFAITTIAIVIGTWMIAHATLSIRGVNTCSVCGKHYWGKQSALKDKPTCDICYEAWYVEHGTCKTTRWEDRNKEE